MQGICNYIPETNHVSMVEIVAAVLLLQFMVNVMLLPFLNVFYFPKYVLSAQYGCCL
jgi:hypothetical protein